MSMVDALVQRPECPFDYESQPKEDVEACNACGSKLWVTLARQDRYGLPVTSHCCHSCGLIFLSPRMTLEAYAEFYRGAYRELIEWYTPGSLPAGEESQTRYAKKIIPLLEPYVASDAGYVLDIGGAPGVCARKVSEALRLDCDPCIVDPAGGDVPEAFEDWEPKGKFDIILCCQTVDHLLDLRGSLEKMRSLLSDDGVLWVDCKDWLYMIRQSGNLHSTIKVDHVYSLNEATFMLLLAEVGLEIVRMAYQGTHIGFVCKKGTLDVGALRRWGHTNPVLANARKKAAEWSSAKRR